MERAFITPTANPLTIRGSETFDIFVRLFQAQNPGASIHLRSIQQLGWRNLRSNFLAICRQNLFPKSFPSASQDVYLPFNNRTQTRRSISRWRRNWLPCVIHGDMSLVPTPDCGQISSSTRRTTLPKRYPPKSHEWIRFYHKLEPHTPSLYAYIRLGRIPPRMLIRLQTRNPSQYPPSSESTLPGGSRSRPQLLWTTP